MLSTTSTANKISKDIGKKVDQILARGFNGGLGARDVQSGVTSSHQTKNEISGYPFHGSQSNVASLFETPAQLLGYLNGQSTRLGRNRVIRYCSFTEIVSNPRNIRPLTLQELACAASLADPRKVREMCTRSLITVSREIIRLNEQWKSNKEDVINFNLSVKKYLTSNHLPEADETA